MDGTLLDSLSVWADSDREFITGLGYDYDNRHSLAMKTMHFDSACEYLVQAFGLKLSAEETGEQILQIVEDKYLHGIDLKSGALELKLRSRGTNTYIYELYLVVSYEVPTSVITVNAETGGTVSGGRVTRTSCMMTTVSPGTS